MFLTAAQQFQTTTEGEASAAFFLALVLMLLIAVAALSIFMIASMWRVFEKAGEPGWAALVPVYNSWKTMEISGKPGWWVLIGIASIIPLVGIIATIASMVLWAVAMMSLARAFGKSDKFGILLWLVPFVGFPILAFGDAIYQTPTMSTDLGINSPAQPTATLLNTPEQPPTR